MPIYGFDYATAKKLKDMASRRMLNDDLPDFRDISLRDYVVILDEPAQAAEKEGNYWVLGVTTGVIWSRYQDEDSYSSQDPDNSANPGLRPHRDEFNRCVRVRVFNPLQRIVPACVPVNVLQDNHGDLYIVNSDTVALGTGTTTATYDTTTTTTPKPCSGKCKWTWSSTDGYWTRVSSTCSQTTTTTSAPTTTTTSDPSTTTTTTADPCLCQTTTTTTTPSPSDPSCDCLYPEFCGTTTGDITYTGCANGVVQPRVTCTSTTTSTTPVCDCATTTTTTTTTNPSCTGGCHYVCLPVSGSLQWVKTSDKCGSMCPCSAPITTCSSACQETDTSCQQTTTTAPPPPPPCEGSCVWYWVSGASDWVIHTNGCSSISNCFCVKPSYAGNDCNSAITPCQVPTVATTTSTTPSGPCWRCYTTTTTSTTTTTVTPCSQRCKYQWNGTAWTNISNPCPSNCPCSQPGFNGTDTNEIQETSCGTGTTTTTTSTTTTTTCRPNGYSCYLQCISGIWVAVGASCCTTPASQTCCVAGACVGEACPVDTGVVVGSCSITTTTLTTAPPPPPP